MRTKVIASVSTEYRCDIEELEMEILVDEDTDEITKTYYRDGRQLPDYYYVRELDVCLLALARRIADMEDRISRLENV